MSNPFVTIDLTEHPMYSTVDYYKFLARVWKAEVLMLNVNKGNMRVRLYDIETGKLDRGNFDVGMEYIVEDEIVVKVR